MYLSKIVIVNDDYIFVRKIMNALLKIKSKKYIVCSKVKPHKIHFHEKLLYYTRMYSCGKKISILLPVSY